MARPLFTAEELEELRRADAEIDDDYSWDSEAVAFSRKLDRQAKYDRMTNSERKIAERNAAYYEANKDKIAERRAANREKYNAYMREYQRKRRMAAKEKPASGVRDRKAGGKKNTVLL